MITGLVGGLRPTQILQALYHGCGRLVWMFILYWLYNPILELMDGLHAYQGLLDYTQPLLEGISPAWLCFCIFAFNIIGHVPGAAVAQMTFTHKIFGPMLMAAGVPPQGTHCGSAGFIAGGLVWPVPLFGHVRADGAGAVDPSQVHAL